MKLKMVYKPDSVYCSYLSRINVTIYLKQPTRIISGYRQARNQKP